MPKKKTAAEPVQVVEAQEAVARVKVFTEAELFYITEKAKSQSAQEIADTLKCSVEDVQPHIPENPIAGASKPEHEKTPMHNLMGGVSKSGKRGGMSVMTPPASQYADATQQSRINPSSTVVQGRNVDCIHRPLG